LKFYTLIIRSHLC